MGAERPTSSFAPFDGFDESLDRLGALSSPKRLTAGRLWASASAKATADTQGWSVIKKLIQGRERGLCAGSPSFQHQPLNAELRTLNAEGRVPAGRAPRPAKAPRQRTCVFCFRIRIDLSRG